MDLRAVLITLAIFVAVIVCAESDDKDAERECLMSTTRNRKAILKTYLLVYEHHAHTFSSAEK